MHLKLVFIWPPCQLVGRALDLFIYFPLHVPHVLLVHGPQMNLSHCTTSLHGLTQRQRTQGSEDCECVYYKLNILPGRATCSLIITAHPQPLGKNNTVWECKVVPFCSLERLWAADWCWWWQSLTWSMLQSCQTALKWTVNIFTTWISEKMVSTETFTAPGLLVCPVHNTPEDKPVVNKCIN